MYTATLKFLGAAGEMKTFAKQDGGVNYKQELLFETIEANQNIKPSKVVLSAWNDSINIFAAAQSGTTFDVKAFVSSREHNGKYYTDIKLWKAERSQNQIQSTGSAPVAVTPAPVASATQQETGNVASAGPAVSSPAVPASDTMDDLPF